MIFPRWRCPNGSALTRIHAQPVNAPHFLSHHNGLGSGRCSLHVVDIARIYSDVPRDYTLSELCITSRFRAITPEDKGAGGVGRLFKWLVYAVAII